MWSHITKLSVDKSSKELFITDQGCMLIIKVGLLDSSCSQFGWEYIPFLVLVVKHKFLGGKAGCPKLILCGQCRLVKMSWFALTWKERYQFWHSAREEHCVERVATLHVLATQVYSHLFTWESMQIDRSIENQLFSKIIVLILGSFYVC